MKGNTKVWGNRLWGAVMALCICAALSLPVPVSAGTELVVWHAYRGQEKSAFEEVIANYNKKVAAQGVSRWVVKQDAFWELATKALANSLCEFDGGDRI